MAVEPHHIHVQEDGLALRCGHDAAAIAGAAIGVDHVEAAAMDIVEPRPVAGTGASIQPPRRPGRNADAIVLAQEDERHRRALIGGPAGGVERALRRRMVGRGVAEAGEHDRIARQRRVLELQHPGDADAERRAHRLGQMRGDGAGLRRDGERLRADHLVAAAGDRVLGRGGEAQQHVPGRGLAGRAAWSDGSGRRSTGSGGRPCRRGARPRRPRHCSHGPTMPIV